MVSEVRAVDPDDLSSPLVYRVEVVRELSASNEPERLPDSQRRLLLALRGLGAFDAIEGARRSELGDRMARDANRVPPLKERTFSRAKHELLAAGLVDHETASGSDAIIWLTAYGAALAERLANADA